MMQPIAKTFFSILDMSSPLEKRTRRKGRDLKKHGHNIYPPLKANS
jgi:hypothetical protein